MLVGFGFALVVTSLGCGASSAGAGGAGGSGDGGIGGIGGIGGGGGMGGGGGTYVPRCNNISDCDDGEPCTNGFCNDGVCEYEPLADDTRCASDLGLSICLTGECQLIWPTCTDPGAKEGDFCQLADDSTRIGRCTGGSCGVSPCEIGFDCWDQDFCTDDVCDSNGECSHPTAPDGTSCGVVVPRECVAGQCLVPAPQAQPATGSDAGFSGSGPG